MKTILRFLGIGKKKDVQKTEDVNDNKLDDFDPLDVVTRSGGWVTGNYKPLELVSAAKFMTYVPSTRRAMDSAKENGEAYIDRAAQDSREGCQGIVDKGITTEASPVVAPALEGWYMSQGFIGYQMCAIIAQHWLVDKACSQAGEDAARNGWELKTDGDELEEEQLSRIREVDTEMGVEKNLAELVRFKNIFGIRVAIFKVDSDDPDYYEKPFNIDGITKGSYRGISQVDPYWMTPQLTGSSTADPSSIHFYEPEYWVIAGRKYHRSHLIICRGPQPADILKPTYIFGGVSMVQRIYERVYAAERTANEAPLLSLNKRTTAIHVDVAKAMMNEKSFVERIAFWTRFRDNYAVKVLGKEETMEQFDTNLSDFDSIIMNQYQIVAAIAKTPSTKLLGTSPKGFNATGEFESVSYHEELESIQRHDMMPMLDRHYLILLKSEGIETRVNVVFNPVGTLSAKERAELNKIKSETDLNNTSVGSISPDEARNRLKADKQSGYSSLTDDEAETEMGMTPEAIADLEKANADSDKGNAALAAAGGSSVTPGSVPTPGSGNGEQSAAVSDTEVGDVRNLLADIASKLQALNASLTPEGRDIATDASPGIKRSVKPSVSGMTASVAGTGAVVKESDPNRLPRMKVGGILCSLENPRGSIRTGKNGDWSVKMPHHYGFIRDTAGADGDEVDCFIGPNLASGKVYIVDQKGKEGQFDEHKCMLGFDSMDDAKNGYLGSYSEGWDGMGEVTEMAIDEFKAWLSTGDLKSPAGKGSV